MTTTTTSRVRTGARTPTRRHPLGRMVRTEALLLLRDGGTAFFTIFFPAVLLVGLGLLMPWADEPFGEGPELSAITAITGYAPIVLALAVGTAALSTMPTTIGGYREKGVLRRLSTTPMPPSRILLAQILVALGGLSVASVLAVTAGVVVLDISLPTQPGVVLAAFLLGAGAALALGCLIASRAATAGAATAMGMIAWTASMFFAGVWMPLPLMPEVVRTISAYTPIGAASQAMAQGWYGTGVPAHELVVMAVWTGVAVPLAARLFRWS
ncbi:ABC transporter permease [Cellulomonas sp. APG4]|uniref:ABC transporter permease n=1 Tax=Cellulomonas sp. APG4 TaxID=1538656 RepID=UPI00137A0B16|nr:ABC transporter permease [Cellulomonas sp. APG4]NCT91302.1 ABC transporter permease [Cellulomonas sp. APG4]